MSRDRKDSLFHLRKRGTISTRGAGQRTAKAQLCACPVEMDVVVATVQRPEWAR
jgi:hypothetical protein